MDDVRYRIVPGFPDYIAGTDGTLWSCRKNGRLAQVAGSKKPRGHLVASLSADGKPSLKTGIHRIVLTTFVGPCPSGQEACHSNGIPDDNRLENLRWDTAHANHLDRVKHGVVRRGSNHGRAKLTESDVCEIRSSSETLTSLSKRFPVCIETLSEIRKGEIWKHVA